MARDRRSFVLGTSLTLLGLTGNARSVLSDSTETTRSCRPIDPLLALQTGDERLMGAWQNQNRAETRAERCSHGQPLAGELLFVSRSDQLRPGPLGHDPDLCRLPRRP